MIPNPVRGRVGPPCLGEIARTPRPAACKGSLVIVALGLWFQVGILADTAIAIPNGSFETPVTPFVSVHIDSWQKMPKRPNYDESAGYKWEQLAGVFKNTRPGAVDHIDNCDGSQAVYLFATSRVGFFQDHDSTDWSNAAPTHAFDARFEVGKSYTLTTGVIGGGGNMLEGVTLEISLYYRDGASNQVPVATFVITNRWSTFPVRTHLVDFRVQAPVVQPGDPWAGKNIGVRVLSTVQSDMEGGYWDVDNLRLLATTPPPLVLGQTQVGQDLRISWPSVAGFNYQLEISGDLQTWNPQGTSVDGTGGTQSQAIPIGGHPRACFRVRATPVP